MMLTIISIHCPEFDCPYSVVKNDYKILVFFKNIILYKSNKYNVIYFNIIFVVINTIIKLTLLMFLRNNRIR